MPPYRLLLSTVASTLSIAWLIVSTAAAQDPSQSAAGSTAAQDPFQVAEKATDTGATTKKTTKPAEPKSEFVRKTNQEWARILPRSVYRVTRLKETEPAFSGRYAVGHFRGTFVCACCEAELFSSKAKFDSGTGWPSFWQPVTPQAIDRAADYLEAEQRVEVMCHRCGAHLGHVFDDAPATPTGLRFCINSLSLKLRTTGAGQTGTASSETRSKSKVKAAKTRTSNAMISGRKKGKSGAAANPDAAGASDDKTARPQAPPAGKTSGD
jgi:peptide-methionine (R)-S-oxide reductase